MSGLARAGVAAAICLPALAAVPFMPCVVAAFTPADGESPRHGVPGIPTFAGLVTVVVGGFGFVLHDHSSWLPAYVYLGVPAVVLAAVDIRVHRLPDLL